MSDSKPPEVERRTLLSKAIIFATCAVEGLDLQLLPSTFRALESQLGVTPTMLGTFAMGQALFCAAAGPVWGALADRGFSRKTLIACGAAGWGTVTILLGLAYDWWIIFILRCLNGLALASLSPICQSIVGDLTEKSERGITFGAIQAMMFAGSGVSSVLVTAVSETEYTLLGITMFGWRFAFITVGLLSLGLCLLIWFGLEEPPRGGREREDSRERDDKKVEEGREGEREEEDDVHKEEEAQQDLWTIIKYEVKLFASYFKIPSFVAIVVQGMFGLVPWHAISFLTLWFQYMSMSNTLAGFLITLQTFALAAGSLLGGYVGDRMAELSPYHGRPFTAQISVASGIAIFLSILFLVPKEADSFALFACLLILFGLTASWAGVGCNSPLLIELVSVRSRARILALLISLNGAVAAMLGGPAVGFAAEFFGYQTPDQGKQVEQMEDEERMTNLGALTEALAVSTVVPWLICLAAFTALHFTYQRDVQYARLR
mmetsp:Transcript_25286/g.60037  ORF Transcript_25286/g.60037 Transcript_25286/m.60037 type:complete len:490 (-) Transcript_25286:166-1635(-)